MKGPDAIRRIFAAKRDYAIAEVSDLIGVDTENLLREIETGDLSAPLAAADARLPWKEVAYLALRTWPLDLIFEALGAEADSLLPELLRPTAITTRLPSYQVRMLEVLAEYHKLDLSTFLQLHLLDLASVESSMLADRIPGFIEAFRFPYGGEV